uniref:UDP-glucuronosyltransferase n=1 Tax=Steinernema glaseri TaxID=37863 RepID=A0A1I7ZEG1_9BILA
MWSAFLFTVFVLATGDALKIVVFTPDQANSQIIWNKRVSEELVKAGHDVTMVVISAMKIDKPAVKIHPNVTVWHLDASIPTEESMEESMKMMAFEDIPMWDARMRSKFSKMADIFVKSCEKVILNKEFMEKLKNANFDLAFAHMYENCPIGLIHYARIPTWIWLNSGALMDLVAYDVGVPSPPSYVPPMMSDASDEMTFGQRVKSQIGQALMPLLYPKLIVNPQTALFRKHIDPNFPDLRELGRQCPLVMVNSNEFYDLPRPILHKIVYIGGLGMKKVDAKPLEAEFKTAVDNAKKVVLMTFGSACDTKLMPESWKKAFMGAFRRFPDVQFVLRYADSDLDQKKPKNVLLAKWIPQADLLQHPKTAALISHGGYNSLQEAINAGKPIITIPLFGDQSRNGRIAQKHGFGYLLQKAEISEENIVAALEAVLNDPKYGQSVQRMHSMLEKKPVQPEALLRRWTEFLGEFKQLDNLVPYGTKLGFVQYHNLDVIATLIGSVFAVLFVAWKLLKLVVTTCCCRTRVGKVKTN